MPPLSDGKSGQQKPITLKEAKSIHLVVYGRRMSDTSAGGCIFGQSGLRLEDTPRRLLRRLEAPFFVDISACRAQRVLTLSAAGVAALSALSPGLSQIWRGMNASNASASTPTSPPLLRFVCPPTSCEAGDRVTVMLPDGSGSRVVTLPEGAVGGSSVQLELPSA